ncbi:MAG TPA: hypothetical protein VKB78_05745 [Pirellulales bacterium]|nr:hypothetical protein [Pirellulales bacterium]
MRSNVIGAVVVIGFLLIAGQAMAQRDQNAGGTPGTAPAAAVSKPDITKPEATNPANAAGNTNPSANSGVPAPLHETTNPAATNPSFNFNNPNNNAATTNPNATGSNLNNPASTTNTNSNNPNANNQNSTTNATGPAATGPANTGSRSDTGAQSRTDSSGERGNRDDIQWRYRFYNGVWWYWLPSNRWAFWSNGAWQDYNPSTVNYQYEYDQNGRPIRYRTGYRGDGEQNRAGNEITTPTQSYGTDIGRRETNTDNTRRQSEANKTDANRTDRENKSGQSAGKSDQENRSSDANHSDQNRSTDPNRSSENRSSADRSDRDRDSSKSGDKGSDDSSKKDSSDHSESKAGK